MVCPLHGCYAFRFRTHSRLCAALSMRIMRTWLSVVGGSCPQEAWEER
jgi:hypothetical protein